MEKKIFISLFVLFFVVLSSFAGDGLPKDFSELLKRASLTYKIPEGFVEAKIVENPHMAYEYALKHSREKFEVRYAIRPIDEMIAEYEEWNKNPKEGEKRLDPRDLYPAIVQAVSFNVADKIIQGGALPEESLANDFGAEAGMSYFLTPRKEFSKGYKHTMMVAIHKKEIGTVFIFFMFDDHEVFKKSAMPIFYNLRFK